ncbi:hypothetical protein [Terrisporobacter sp.]
MKKLDRNKKIVMLCIILPLLFFVQYYLFKVGIVSPMVKGVNIKIIQGEYIQDIDKYVVKLGDKVVLSAGDYVKIPQYAKDPKIKFSILDNSKTVKLDGNYKKEENTVILNPLKTGYTSVAVMKNSRVLQKVTILVVDPDIKKLDVSLDKNLKYVGDKSEIDSSVEVDYKEFNNTYKVTYESSNENVLKIKNNEVEAVGVGRATIYAKSKDKVKAIRFNIVARVKAIDIDSSFDISVGQVVKLKPKIVTYPRNLKPPEIFYKFLKSKLPVQRAITFNEDGTIVGIREGSEKIIITCGKGENKHIEVVTINVKEGTLENANIRNLNLQYTIDNNRLKINLSWDILNGATNYDIYVKNELDKNPKYDLYKSITQEKFLKIPKTTITIELGENVSDISYDIYVVGRNEESTSKPSNIESIRQTIEKEENKEDNNTDKNTNIDGDKDENSGDKENVDNDMVIEEE